MIDDPPDLADDLVAALVELFDGEPLSEPFYPRNRPWFARAYHGRAIEFFASAREAVAWLREVNGGWVHDARRYPLWHVCTVTTDTGDDDDPWTMTTAGFEPRGQEPHPRPDLPAERWRWHKELPGGRLLIAVGSDASMFWQAEVRTVVRRPERLVEGRLGRIEKSFGPVQSAAGLLAALKAAGLVEGGER